MSETHDIKGFNQGPLDNDKTVLFVSKLEEARRRVKTKVEKHQVHLLLIINPFKLTSRLNSQIVNLSERNSLANRRA